MKQEFLSILECYMHDGVYSFPEDFDQLEELYKFSQNHKMVAAVFEQIRRDDICQKDKYQALMMEWKQEAIRSTMLQIQREAEFLRLYQELVDAGCKPLVVKGIACRYLYSKPDYRISSDEDLLIRREDFEQCDRVILQAGYWRSDLDTSVSIPQEITYRHPKTGAVIELHLELFSKESGAYGHLNDEFSDVWEHVISFPVKGVKIWTLSWTDHLFYLICHALKHFLHGGFGIRQVCDMVMMIEFAAAEGQRMQWDVLEEKLSRLHMDAFWSGLAEIGRVYLGFDWAKVAYPVKLQASYVGMEDLLEDLLDSGIYGGSTMARRHSANITLSAAQSGKRNTIFSLLNSLFPELSYMKSRYPWVKRTPMLLPFAWMVRIVQYLGNRKNFDTLDTSDTKTSLEIGMERVELLRKYRIIDE